MNLTPEQLIKEKQLTPFHFVKKKRCGIYLLFCAQDGTGYIGQSRNIYDRLIAHKNDFIKGHINPRIRNVINKYGIGCFEFYVIEDCLLKHLTERETYYYNLIEGEFRLNNRHPLYVPSMTEEQVQKGVSSRKGIKRTQEQKDHLSKKMKGRIISAETRQKMSIGMKEYSKQNMDKKLEHIKVLADKRRGTKLSKEWIAKLAKAKLGKVHVQKASQYLTEDQAREIKILLATTKLTQAEIGKKFGISYGAVGRIKNGSSWARITIEGISHEQLSKRTYSRNKKGQIDV